MNNHCCYCPNDADPNDWHEPACNDCHADLLQLEAEERSERAMQAGMAFGCAGFNDAMGW